MGLNVNVFRTPTVWLKLIHVFLGALSLGIVGYYSSKQEGKLSGIGVFLTNEIFFFLLTTFAFLLTSFLLLVSYLIDDTAEKMGPSYFEIMYHLFGGIFCLPAGICLFKQMMEVEYSPGLFNSLPYRLFLTAACDTIGNSILYMVGCFVAYRLRSRNGQNLNQGGVILGPYASSAQSIPTAAYVSSVPTVPYANQPRR